jgi:transposase
LHLALDLGNRTWKLAFATSIAHAPRLRTMPARDLGQLDAEIAAAKVRFGLPPNAPVVSCYEAGRDGFWLHRALSDRGVTSHVVDSASITENRRARRAKSTASTRPRSCGSCSATTRASAACGAWCTCRVSRTRTGDTCTASSSR